MNQLNTTINQNDALNCFLFDKHSVRGEIVKLNQTYQDILHGKDYPVAVQNLLGEMLVATSLLTATLKFDGDIAVQLQGDGPVSLIVVNGDNKQQLRGVARINEERSDEITENASLKSLIGNGIIVITITPKQGERYQGIVGLEKETFSECIENYFMQSEQLPTRIFIKTGVTKTQPIAAGMLLQVLPSQDADAKTAFEHLTILGDTLKSQELFELPVQDILHRLYHEEDIHLYETQPVVFKCSCSRKRCEDSLMTLSCEEIDSILAEDGKIDMHCDYCGTQYLFDKIDIAQLRNSSHDTQLDS